MKESVRIKTNDPNRPWLQVAVKGPVKKFAEIRPERINFRGAAGETLVAEVEIIPKPDFPFTIKGIRAGKDQFIKYELTKRCTDSRNSCLIQVKNIKKDKGRYADVLYIETDSRIKPEIPIYVMGMIN